MRIFVGGVQLGKQSVMITVSIVRQLAPLSTVQRLLWKLLRPVIGVIGFLPTGVYFIAVASPAKEALATRVAHPALRLPPAAAGPL
jgi:hypothetical protein